MSEYFTRVFSTVVDRTFPRGRRIAYVTESKLLLVEWQLPSIDVVPREKEYRYNKATDSVGVHKWRSAGDVRAVYHKLLAQLALRAASTAFASDPAGLVDTVVFNGVVDTTDDDAGDVTRDDDVEYAGPCLISMSTSRRRFARINLDDLDDPVSVVRKQCGAELSAYPDELAAITPVLPYDLADPGVVSSTASRAPNMTTAAIEEFHRLAERLLERMGYALAPLETDSGDYLASHQLPGGGSERCVVHVRRAAGLLEASAARGLQSAVRRERADTGILLTTAGIDPQAFEYAHGRRMQLYDGHSVLALCHRHALPARIEPEAPPVGTDRPTGLPEQQRHDRTPSSIDR